MNHPQRISTREWCATDGVPVFLIHNGWISYYHWYSLLFPGSSQKGTRWDRHVLYYIRDDANWHFTDTNTTFIALFSAGKSRQFFWIRREILFCLKVVSLLLLIFISFYYCQSVTQGQNLLPWACCHQIIKFLIPIVWRSVMMRFFQILLHPTKLSAMM